MNNFYDPFGKMPPFHAKRQERDIIDVDYTEVKEDAKMSEADKELRSRQIAEAAMKHFPIKDGNDGLTSLLHSILFSAGASWADKNPSSNFQSRAKWHVAMSDEFNKRKPDGESGSDPVINAMLLLTFYAGAGWAVENPFKRV